MRCIHALSAALFLLAVSGTTVMAEELFAGAEGKWLTEWETTTGEEKVAKTTFDAFGGMSSIPGPIVTFYSADANGLWEGTWTADSAPETCKVEKDGKSHWGVVRFQFNKSYDEFEGTWDFCGEGRKLSWKGKRVQGW